VLKDKLNFKEPEGYVEVDILELQRKMMNPIKRALLARLDTQPLSNISEPKLASEKVEESSDEEEPPAKQEELIASIESEEPLKEADVVSQERSGGVKRFAVLNKFNDQSPEPEDVGSSPPNVLVSPVTTTVNPNNSFGSRRGTQQSSPRRVPSLGRNRSKHISSGR